MLWASEGHLSRLLCQYIHNRLRLSCGMHPAIECRVEIVWKIRIEGPALSTAAFLHPRPRCLQQHFYTPAQITPFHVPPTAALTSSRILRVSPRNAAQRVQGVLSVIEALTRQLGKAPPDKVPQLSRNFCVAAPAVHLSMRAWAGRVRGRQRGRESLPAGS
jgi:hypothetical protein